MEYEVEHIKNGKKNQRWSMSFDGFTNSYEDRVRAALQLDLVIPQSAHSCKFLTPNEIMLAGLIYTQCNIFGAFTLKNSDVSKVLNISAFTVRRCFDALWKYDRISIEIDDDKNRIVKFVDMKKIASK